MAYSLVRIGPSKEYPRRDLPNAGQASGSACGVQRLGRRCLTPLWLGRYSCQDTAWSTQGDRDLGNNGLLTAFLVTWWCVPVRNTEAIPGLGFVSADMHRLSQCGGNCCRGNSTHNLRTFLVCMEASIDLQFSLPFLLDVASLPWLVPRDRTGGL